MTGDCCWKISLHGRALFLIYIFVFLRVKVPQADGQALLLCRIPKSFLLSLLEVVCLCCVFVLCGFHFLLRLSINAWLV